MRRVLFIGNSHLAAIKQGFDSLERELSFTPTFFGSPSGTLRDLVAAPDTISSGSARLSAALNQLWRTDRMDLSQFDAVCLVGLGAGIRLVGPLYEGFRSDEHLRAPHKHLVSQATFDRCLQGLVGGALFASVARTVRQATSLPILALAQPGPSQAMVERAPGGWVDEAIGAGDAPILKRALMEAVASVGGCRFIAEQPAETVWNAVLTKAEYMAGSVRLRAGDAEAHDEDDITHANAAYGAKALADFDADLEEVLR